MSLAILWEDDLQVGAKPVDFGPHILLAAALADRLATDDDWYLRREQLRRSVNSHPCGGVDKLIAKICDEKMYAQGHQVLAIYDDDKIRERLNLSPDRARASQDDVNRALVERAFAPRQLTPRAIGHNLENFIRVLASPAVGGTCTTDELDTIARKASRGQALRYRDIVLQRHANLPTRPVRERLAAASAEWRAIVDVAVAALNPSAGG